MEMGVPEPQPATEQEGAAEEPLRAVEARLLRAADRYAAAPQDAEARASLLRAARRLRPAADRAAAGPEAGGAGAPPRRGARRPGPPAGDGEDETTTWSGVLVDPAHVRRLEDEVRWVDARAGAVLAALPDLVLLLDA